MSFSWPIDGDKTQSVGRQAASTNLFLSVVNPFNGARFHVVLKSGKKVDPETTRLEYILSPGHISPSTLDF